MRRLGSKRSCAHGRQLEVVGEGSGVIDPLENCFHSPSSSHQLPLRFFSLQLAPPLHLSCSFSASRDKIEHAKNRKYGCRGVVVLGTPVEGRTNATETWGWVDGGEAEPLSDFALDLSQSRLGSLLVSLSSPPKRNHSHTFKHRRAWPPAVPAAAARLPPDRTSHATLALSSL